MKFPLTIFLYIMYLICLGLVFKYRNSTRRCVLAVPAPPILFLSITTVNSAVKRFVRVH